MNQGEQPQSPTQPHRAHHSPTTTSALSQHPPPAYHPHQHHPPPPSSPGTTALPPISTALYPRESASKYYDPTSDHGRSIARDPARYDNHHYSPQVRASDGPFTV